MWPCAKYVSIRPPFLVNFNTLVDHFTFVIRTTVFWWIPIVNKNNVFLGWVFFIFIAS